MLLGTWTRKVDDRPVSLKLQPEESVISHKGFKYLFKAIAPPSPALAFVAPS